MDLLIGHTSFFVEDEAKTAAYLSKGLCENGFTVDVASDGSDGLYWRLLANTTL